MSSSSSLLKLIEQNSVVCSSCGSPFDLANPHRQHSADCCVGVAQFVSPPSETLRCGITHEVVYTDERSVVTDCQHLFDRHSLEARLGAARSARCPVCSQSAGTVRPSRAAQDSVLQLVIYCVKKSDGCQWKGRIDEFSDHAKDECVFIGTACFGEACAFTGTRAEVATHAKSCAHAALKLKARDFERRLKRMETHLEQAQNRIEQLEKMLENNSSIHNNNNNNNVNNDDVDTSTPTNNLNGNYYRMPSASSSSNSSTPIAAASRLRVTTASPSNQDQSQWRSLLSAEGDAVSPPSVALSSSPGSSLLDTLTDQKVPSYLPLRGSAPAALPLSSPTSPNDRSNSTLFESLSPSLTKRVKKKYFCSKCKVEGHDDDHCPISHQGCFGCGSTAHQVKYCPEKCSLCGKAGHGRQNCPRRFCTYCGAQGHTESRCFKKAVCSYCGQQGHMVDRCFKRGYVFSK